MKKLTLLILALMVVITACVPAQPAAPSVDPANLALPATRPAKNPNAVPTSGQASDIPLSESLLLMRYIAKTQHHLLTAIDPANGRELTGVAPISLEQDYSYAVSPNRQSLAVIPYKSAGSPHAGNLLLIDLRDWSTRSINLGRNQSTGMMAYSPDGRLVALVSSEYNNTILVVDVLQGKLLAQGKTGLSVYRMKFNADSTSLMVYAFPEDPSDRTTTGDPVVGLLSVGDLSWQWRADLPGVRDGLYRKQGKTGELHAPGNAYLFAPGRIFAPNADLFYVANAEKDELVSVDFAARSVKTRAVHAELSWLEQLLALTAGRAQAKAMDGSEKSVIISPDGRFLYISAARNEFILKEGGASEFKRVLFGLQIVRAADAVETGKFETESTDMTISPDGKFLYLREWKSELNAAFPVTNVFDTTQGKIIASLDNFYLTPTHRLDGQPALVSGYSTDSDQTQMAVFGADGMKPLYEWQTGDYASWLVLP